MDEKVDIICHYDDVDVDEIRRSRRLKLNFHENKHVQISRYIVPISTRYLIYGIPEISGVCILHKYVGMYICLYKI